MLMLCIILSQMHGKQMRNKEILLLYTVTFCHSYWSCFFLLLGSLFMLIEQVTEQPIPYCRYSN